MLNRETHQAFESGALAHLSAQSLTGVWAIHSQMGASLVAQMVKNPPVMQETQVRSLSQEDPLEEEMAICSSILAWRIPWMEEPSRLQSMWSQRVRRD